MTTLSAAGPSRITLDLIDAASFEGFKLKLRRVTCEPASRPIDTFGICSEIR